MSDTERPQDRAPAKAAKPPRKKRGRPSNQAIQGSETTRDRILRVARRRFASAGYEGTSLTQIAQVVGVSQSVIHYHFTSKEKLWQAVMTDFMRSVMKAFPLELPPAAEGDSAAVIRYIIRRHMLISANFRDFATIIINESSHDTVRMRWLADRYFRPAYAMFDAQLDRARARGEISDIPNHIITNIAYSAASVLFSVTPMIAHVYGIDINTRFQKEPTIEAAIEALMLGLLAPGGGEGAA